MEWALYCSVLSQVLEVVHWLLDMNIRVYFQQVFFAQCSIHNPGPLIQYKLALWVSFLFAIGQMGW